MQNTSKYVISFLTLFSIGLIGVLIGHYIGYDIGYERAVRDSVTEDTNGESSKTTWETYRSDAHGFEFVYPNTWTLTENDSAPNIVSLSDPQRKEALEKNPFLNRNITIDYFKSIEEEPNNIIDDFLAKTLSEFVEESRYVDNVKEITLDKRYKAFEMNMPGIVQNFAVMIDKEGEVYQIFFGGQEGRNSLSEVERLILESFKFYPTDPSTHHEDTSNWEKYRNDVIGLSFIYPPDFSSVRIFDEGSVTLSDGAGAPLAAGKDEYYMYVEVVDDFRVTNNEHIERIKQEYYNPTFEEVQDKDGNTYVLSIYYYGNGETAYLPTIHAYRYINDNSSIKAVLFAPSVRHRDNFIPLFTTIINSLSYTGEQ